MKMLQNHIVITIVDSYYRAHSIPSAAPQTMQIHLGWIGFFLEGAI